MENVSPTDFEHGVVEFFDGTLIDLTRIVAISSIRGVDQEPGQRMVPLQNVGFNITYMMRPELSLLRYTAYQLVSLEEVQNIYKRHYDEAAAAGARVKNYADVAEFNSTAVRNITAHRDALVDAWLSHKGAAHKTIRKISGV